jgi:cyclophilin family peptidyl-prolyl cis-trans isomerase
MNPLATFTTSLGDFTLALFEIEAPATVANFRQYILDEFYRGTIFHRVMPNFMVQGGGYEENMQLKTGTRAPIPCEPSTERRNRRGTIAAARAMAPHTATAQFFINLRDNANLDPDLTEDGFGQCVFGSVVEGMETVDRIASVKTGSRGGHWDVPVQSVLIADARWHGAVELASLPWKDETVLELARGIYSDGAYDRLPILADAMEEAGGTCAGVLDHLRTVPHLRGCWVIDLLTGAKQRR